MSKQKEIAAKLEGASGDQGKAIRFFMLKHISYYTFFIVEMLVLAFVILMIEVAL